MKKFPKALYVKRIKDGEAEYFNADDALMTLVDMGEKEAIAVYKLESIMDAEGVVQTSKSRKQK